MCQLGIDLMKHEDWGLGVWRKVEFIKKLKVKEKRTKNKNIKENLKTN